MELEVKESVVGAFVPQHLLDFDGDPGLQCYYRKVIEDNYERGITKVDLGGCAMCYHLLTVWDQPRCRPAMKQSHRIAKIMEKSKTGKLSKHQDYLLKKYLKSSTKLKVHCPACGHVNTTKVITRQECLAVKERLVQTAQSLHWQEAQVKEEAPLTKSKKKKLKRKRKKQENADDTLIPSLEERIPTSPFSSSPSQPPLPSSNITKTFTPTPSNPTSTPTRRKQMFAAPVASTPAHRVNLSSKNVPSASTNNGGSRSKKKVFKHKQLQAFLKDSSKSGTSTSLKDFLSSL